MPRDVLCVQDVESLIALREFNERFLDNAYRYAVVLDTRDLRQIDVGCCQNFLLTASLRTLMTKQKANTFSTATAWKCASW